MTSPIQFMVNPDDMHPVETIARLTEANVNECGWDQPAHLFAIHDMGLMEKDKIGLGIAYMSIPEQVVEQYPGEPLHILEAVVDPRSVTDNLMASKLLARWIGEGSVTTDMVGIMLVTEAWYNSTQTIADGKALDAYVAAGGLLENHPASVEQRQLLLVTDLGRHLLLVRERDGGPPVLAEETHSEHLDRYLAVMGKLLPFCTQMARDIGTYNPSTPTS